MSRWRKGRFWPGRSWRVLVHRSDGTPHPIELRSEQYVARTEFDELVIGKWIHLEQMGERTWWMRVGNYTLYITIDGYGRPEVSIQEEETPEETAEHCERLRVAP